MADLYPKISIIVPIYNVENYLRRCIDSILNQTYTDFELILVDDGSPDSCPAICDEYANIDPRIRVIHKQNGGVSDTRNAGLKLSKGQYIGFVDSDDTIMPQMYQNLIQALERYDADLAATGIRNITPKGDLFSEYPVLDDTTVYTRKEYIDHFYPDIRWHIMASPCNKLYRKELFFDLQYPVGKQYEDSFVQLPLYDKCDKIVVTTDHDYCYYFIREGSIMNSDYSVKKMQLIELALSQLSFFENKKLPEQQEYALATYLTNYMINFFAVYIQHKQFVNDFMPYRIQFRKYFFRIMTNSKICKMKKLNVLLMFLNKELAYTVAKKYFPESLPEFLR